MKRLLLSLLIVLTVAGQARAGPFEDGEAAFGRGAHGAALKKFLEAANQGHAVAQANVGMMFDQGLGVASNPARAAEWYRLAAEAGNATAQFNLGALYYAGQGLKQDYDAAAQWFAKAAQQGDTEARKWWNLALRRGVPEPAAEPDPAKKAKQAHATARKKAERQEAREQARKQARKQDSTATATMQKPAVAKAPRPAVTAKKPAPAAVTAAAPKTPGIAKDDRDIKMFEGSKEGLDHKSDAYRRGIVAFNKRDFATAMKLFRPLADDGDADAQVNIGMMFLQGWSVKRDYPEAFRWFSKAAEQGLAAGQQNLGFMYYEGLGVGQNDAAAAKWYGRAAEQGDMQAQHNMGVFYEEGRGVQQDSKKAVAWYTKAAKQRHVGSTFNLGTMYRDGNGVAQNYKRAAELFRAIAEHGFAAAQFDLGLLYMLGRGVKQDYAEAEKWYRKAAAQDDAKAQYNLGVMALKGMGRPADPVAAERWIKLAAKNGHAQARKVLREAKANAPAAGGAASAADPCTDQNADPADRVAACTGMLKAGKLRESLRHIAIYNRGLAHQRLGQYDRAIDDMAEVIRLQPDFSVAYNVRAWIMATAEDARFRDGAWAVELARKAIGLKDSIDYRDTLAAALAESGKFDEAVAEQDRAIALLKATGRVDQVADFESRRDLYKKRQPFRQ